MLKATVTSIFIQHSYDEVLGMQLPWTMILLWNIPSMERLTC